MPATHWITCPEHTADVFTDEEARLLVEQIKRCAASGHPDCCSRLAA